MTLLLLELLLKMLLSELEELLLIEELLGPEPLELRFSQPLSSLSPPNNNRWRFFWWRPPAASVNKLVGDVLRFRVKFPSFFAGADDPENPSSGLNANSSALLELVVLVPALAVFEVAPEVFQLLFPP